MDASNCWIQIQIIKARSLRGSKNWLFKQCENTNLKCDFDINKLILISAYYLSIDKMQKPSLIESKLDIILFLLYIIIVKRLISNLIWLYNILSIKLVSDTYLSKTSPAIFNSWRAGPTWNPNRMRESYPWSLFLSWSIGNSVWDWNSNWKYNTSGQWTIWPKCYSSTNRI